MCSLVLGGGEQVYGKGDEKLIMVVEGKQTWALGVRMHA